MSSEKHEEPPLQDTQNPQAVGNSRKGTQDSSLVVTPGQSASKLTSLGTLRPNPLGMVGAQENAELSRLLLLLRQARAAAQKFEESSEAYKTGAQIKEIRQGIGRCNKELKKIAAFEREYDRIKKDMKFHLKEAEKRKMMVHQRAAENHTEQMIRHEDLNREKAIVKYHQNKLFEHLNKYDELKPDFDSMAGKIEVLTRRALDYKNRRDVLERQLAGAQRANACLEVFRESSAGI